MVTCLSVGYDGQGSSLVLSHVEKYLLDGYASSFHIVSHWHHDTVVGNPLLISSTTASGSNAPPWARTWPETVLWILLPSHQKCGRMWYLVLEHLCQFLLVIMISRGWPSSLTSTSSSSLVLTRCDAANSFTGGSALFQVPILRSPMRLLSSTILRPRFPLFPREKWYLCDRQNATLLPLPSTLPAYLRSQRILEVRG